MRTDFKYLHQVNNTGWYLDHRLTPEVRAMLSAMVSRMPEGGVSSRYMQILDSIIASDPILYESTSSESLTERSLHFAEERLTQYPLPTKVVEFIQKWVGEYGHSSIQELTGSPAVFLSGVSWVTAWILFDNPLVCGQENSTRAVSKKDWPMAAEARDIPELEGVHKLGMELYLEEVDRWTTIFKDTRNRNAWGITDPQGFRPALDFARWALPGTASTGLSYTSHIRERSRSLEQLETAAMLYGRSFKGGATAVAKECEDTYRAAMPVLGEQVFSKKSGVPPHEHIKNLMEGRWTEGSETKIEVDTPIDELPPQRKGRYLDPKYNSIRVRVSIECSLAVARDWHRHRTMFPWNLQLRHSSLCFHPRYQSMVELADPTKVKMYRDVCEAAYSGLMAQYRGFEALLALPFGSAMQMSAQGGLRDVVYMLQLRRDQPGANFEYQEQATRLLAQLQKLSGLVLM